jgi:hypothetical protein
MWWNTGAKALLTSGSLTRPSTDPSQSPVPGEHLHGMDGSMMTNTGRPRCLRPDGVFVSLSQHGSAAQDRPKRLDEPCLGVECGERDGIPPTGRFESWLMVT